ncbi:PD-(D/E)XK nuclease-like domain-containing protein [Xylella taiwanensis]|uniref:PD-(D/E)XK nuclease-like domain-containing protein n=1 Tax=Xylella taiwanensis TaxID=1444770 RepID=A0ABS8TTT5_9GAMM|nr:PD-(D/E)XK nuclease-like domain-containing protein [Xylella taiwanensis]AXI83142.1 hypothetical protein AB672_03890 [Xylella taiwanensis]MCD8456191.1 PD-(D/E)XK nuclease-like domain-containing protein [Xylella taiwanensis]MCD8463207.1 PD-(D/E)XK nuclease-like domain-containing protein [Xylella taiwanensis]MCD8473534.1 PD-(D/E)XK nuclease-like domain-containing protein [Xylella taiwanensis]UFM93353.1 PD-(D/E)XK nuclease-like domain-containing protein [Xylella taiwanensis]
MGVASRSVLKLLRETTPAHVCAWYQGHEDENRPALVLARAYHCRVLEPQRFASDFFGHARLRRDLRSSQHRATRDAWMGAQCISATCAERIGAMYVALVSNLLIVAILKEGIAAPMLRWMDEQTGVVCKARPD